MFNIKTAMLMASVLAAAANVTQAATLVAHVDASGFDQVNGHKPENAIDGNPKTRWAAQGKETFITLTLPDNSKVHNVFLIPFNASQRSLKFDIYASLDNQNWSPIIKDINTSKDKKDGETFTFKDTSAKYIKLVTRGTDINNWSAINEIQINK